MKNILVTVSGSFHQYIHQIENAVSEFKELGVQVLSPSDPRVVDNSGNFLFVASDRHRSIRLVQDRHLASIAQSDFLWLVAPPPHRYIGQSASLELGFAIAYGIPVFCEYVPSDDTLRQYVLQANNISQLIDDIRQAGSVGHVVEQKLSHKSKSSQPSLLVDPTEAVNIAHDKLENIKQTLIAGKSHNDHNIDTDTRVINELNELNKLLLLPSFYRRK